jgi:hypothetical protein
MHFSWSTWTTLFSSLVIAFALQTSMHGASSHCWQVIGTLTPASNRYTEILDKAGRNSPSFTKEHANSQDPHPMHFSGDMTKTFSISVSPLCSERKTSLDTYPVCFSNGLCLKQFSAPRAVLTSFFRIQIAESNLLLRRKPFSTFYALHFPKFLAPHFPDRSFVTPVDETGWTNFHAGKTPYAIGRCLLERRAHLSIDSPPGKPDGTGPLFFTGSDTQTAPDTFFFAPEKTFSGTDTVLIGQGS